MDEAKIMEKSKELQRAYMKNWRQQNKDKVAAINKRYWKRRAERELAKEEAERNE